MPNADTKAAKNRPEPAPTTGAGHVDADTESALKRDAHSKATTRLREEYRQRLNEITKEEMTKRGIDWSPRPTEEEKAAKQVAELLAAHPNLREQFQA